MNFNTLACAFTGIAASLLHNGQTIHSMFRIPIPTEHDSVSSLQPSDDRATLLKYSKILIMDEASSTSKHVYSCVDKFLRDARRRPNVPFGGMVVLLTGDFRQTLPIPDELSQISSVDLCLKRSELWQHFTRFRLIQNLRALPEEIIFKDWLMRIGDGIEPTINGKYLTRVPDNTLVAEGSNLITAVYGEPPLTREYLAHNNVAILCPTNKDSLEINDVILSTMEGNLNNINL